MHVMALRQILKSVTLVKSHISLPLKNKLGPYLCGPPLRFKLYRTMSSGRQSSCPYQDKPEVGPKYLKLLERNQKRLKRIKFLAELFKNHGYQLRIAGGAVRDLVNNIEPVDIDLATDAHPSETLKLVERYPDLFRVIVTTAGQKHGTVAVKFKEVDEIDLRKRLKVDEKIKSNFANVEKLKEPVYDDESPYEITTLRCDKTTDGRHAEVEFISDWKKDAERRDLTINSMFLNLDDGELIDYYGGEQDCRNNVVKFVGIADDRIKEDYLRILRYFRFWLRFSRQPPAADQLSAIVSNLEGLNQISGERIWQELKKTLNHLPCSKVVELMLDTKLVNYIGLQVKEDEYEEYSKKVIAELTVVEANVQRYCDDILQPGLETNPGDQNLRKTKEYVPVIVFATLVQTEEMCFASHKRLKFSNLERDIIFYLHENKNKDCLIDAFKCQLVMTNAPDRRGALLRMRAFLIMVGKFQMIDELESWIVPRFPLDGRSVSKAIRDKKLPNSKTKEVIELVKLEWSKGNYQATDQEIETIMHNIINDMVFKSLEN